MTVEIIALVEKNYGQKMFKKIFFLDLTYSSIYLDYYKFIWKVLWLNFRKCGENMMLNKTGTG